MEPISPLQNPLSPQTDEKIPPNPSSWQTFFKEFNPSQQKQFLNNMQHHFSQMIWKQMRKSKEAMQRFKESYH